ncbi:N/A [soil metagenome]
MDKKHTILVVDDDISTLQVISLILDHAGYIIISDPLAELIFLESGINPDLILLDNQVGEKCGSIICHELKRNERTKHIPIILFSGIDNLEELALKACADDYIAKPFTMEALLEKVGSMLPEKAIAC